MEFYIWRISFGGNFNSNLTTRDNKFAKNQILFINQINL
jgi:hypothetical protein